MEKRVLRPSKFSDIFWRGLYGVDYGDARYVVEVDFFDIKEKVCLYRDDRLVEEGNSPRLFRHRRCNDRGGDGALWHEDCEAYTARQRPRAACAIACTAEDRRLSFGRDTLLRACILALRRGSSLQ